MQALVSKPLMDVYGHVHETIVLKRDPHEILKFSLNYLFIYSVALLVFMIRENLTFLTLIFINFDVFCQNACWVWTLD